LGIIMYEMLCGQTPFVSTGFGELVTMHLGMQPKPPRDLNPAVTEELQAVVLKCLEKRPEDRYDSMNEVQIALKTAGGPSVTVRGSSSPNLNGGTIPTINGNAGNKLKTDTAPQSSTRALGLGETLAQGVVPATTLSPVASERQSIFKPKRSGFFLAAGIAAGLSGLLAFKLVGNKTDPSAPPAIVAPTATAAPQVQTVTLSLSSQPVGAAVTRNSDHRLLGHTPFELQLPVSVETLQLTFSLEGFADVQRDLPLNQNIREDIVLSAAPVPNKPPVAEPIKPLVARPKRPKAVADPEEPAKL
jgi:serine/threonine-protein kinase